MQALKIIHWPDPRLKRPSAAVTDFGPALIDLAQQMLDLMRRAEGVGLAAPQVGRNIRLFVCNHSGQPLDDRIYVNPVLRDLDGDAEDDEGCLSIPDIRIKVWRATHAVMDAVDVAGNPIRIVGEEFEARVWQHEIDHLDGILLTDRMGPIERLSWRKKLRELEAAAK